MVWREEQHGEYSVRTGNRLLMRERGEKCNRNVRGHWSSLWKIRAPPKTKHLLWRIGRHCLPTRVRLRQHYVQCPSVCQLCEDEVEDNWHVMFGCQESRQSWAAVGLSTIIELRLLRFNEAKALIHDVCHDEEKEFAVMIWMLWNNRNDRLWNKEKKSATQIGMQAFQMWNDWFKAQNFKQADGDEE
ncbi:unnamed protein product [Trifolium pratense]|uniref:Uncharacterized protein n=1 Tax=Trifolium pratense TaxID=57577 RepID=A0ACB0LLN5_TRIPR|nr:unnamed protein product [Trifolium pratense]